MIGFLRGALIDKKPHELLLDVNGVGYRVLVPVSTFCRVGNRGEKTELLVHTHVREDQIALYGFATSIERDLFEKLISVSGVGPKVAMSILSGIEGEDLVESIRQNDVPRLTRIPGVGKKTAERLILELKDKMREFALTSNPGVPDSPTRGDLTSALLNLGYSAGEADKAAAEVARTRPDESLGDLLRAALAVLARR